MAHLVRLIEYAPEITLIFAFGIIALKINPYGEGITAITSSRLKKF